MSESEYALQQLKRGIAVNCVTPSGNQFQIQSKLSYGIAFYRVFPARKGCLNRFSRLSDTQMLEWLNSVEVKG